MRILVVTDMLDCNGSNFVITNENKEKHRHILNDIINESKNNHYTEIFNKAMNTFEFFFDSISEIEYDVYSRYNFQ